MPNSKLPRSTKARNAAVEAVVRVKTKGRLVNQKEMAAIVGRSDRQLRDEAWQSCPVEDGTGSATLYNTAAVFEWYARKNASSASGVIAAEENEAGNADALRFLKAKADEKEADAIRKLMAVAKARKDLVPRAIVEELINERFIALKQTVEQIVTRYVERWAEPETREERRDLLAVMSKDICQTLSEFELAVPDEEEEEPDTAAEATADAE